MPLNIDLQQILLHLLNVVLLFGILYFLLYSPVKAFIEKRAKYYEDMDQQAKNTLQEAESVKADYEQRLAGAEDEIRARRDEAQAKLNESLNAQRQAAQEEASELLSKAKADAARERDRIVSEAQEEISALVVSAAEKLISESTSEAYDQFLNAAEGTDEHA